jgi:hypothetical protein
MPMNDLMGDSFDDREPMISGSDPVAPCPVGSPLPKGGKTRRTLSPPDPRRLASVPPPGRALPPPEQPPADESGAATNLQRAVSVIRLAMPFVQKLLPLLDGHVATAVSSVLSPQPPQAAYAKPPAPVPFQAQPVDLTPVQDGIKRLQADQREMRNELAEHNTSLKKVEDSLDMVREATDRNTLEQQELMEDLKSVGTKVNVVTLVVIALLVISLLLNLVLYLHMQRVLP